MSCPTCGGQQREPIAPGLWRCTSLRQETIGGPGLTNPALGPPAITRQVVCGGQYQEGPPAGVGAPMCACGTYSIGVCSECGAQVCGTHSQLVAGRRLCYADARDALGAQAVVDREANELAARRTAANHAEAMARRAQEDAAQAALIDRFLAAMRAAGNPGLVPLWRHNLKPGQAQRLSIGASWHAWPLTVSHQTSWYDRSETRVSGILKRTFYLTPAGEWLKPALLPSTRAQWSRRERLLAEGVSTSPGGVVLMKETIPFELFVPELRRIAAEHRVSLAL